MFELSSSTYPSYSHITRCSEFLCFLVSLQIFGMDLKLKTQLKITRTGATLESSRATLASLLGSRDNAPILYSRYDRSESRPRHRLS
jgi:hypothetical protein